MKIEAWHKGLIALSVFLLCLIYYWIGYELVRSQFWLLFSLYASAFGLSVHLYRCGLSLKYLIALSFLFKLIFLFSIPELSQDFYRFIWDGMLNTKGYNPYLHLPEDLIHIEDIQKESISQLLFDSMGELNASNYSTYPPIAQLIYTVSYAFGGSSLLLNIIFIRLFNLIAEIGIVWFSLKILSKLKLPKSQILLFILNPLVILESTFNLHFEVFMLFFLGLSLFYLLKSKIYVSAIGFAGAVVSKMLPLMFLPLLLPYFNKKKNPLNKGQILSYLKYCSILTLSILVGYAYFGSTEIFTKSSQTLGLYFTSFEFNAGIYYVLRSIGYWWTGYNQIGIIGSTLSIFTVVVILYLSFKDKRINGQKLIIYMLIASTTYYLCSTTIHPWYLTLPLFLSIFTKYKYMLLWSFLVFLSYSAYKINDVEENYILIAIEYTAVIGFMLYEIRGKKIGYFGA